MNLNILENKSSYDTDITAKCIRDGFLFFLHGNDLSVLSAYDYKTLVNIEELSGRLFYYNKNYYLVDFKSQIRKFNKEQKSFDKILKCPIKSIGFINEKYYFKRFSERKPERIIWRDIYNMEMQKIATLHNDSVIKYIDQDSIIISDVGQNASVRRVKDDFKTDIWSHSRYGDVKNGPTNYFRKDDRLYLSAMSSNNSGSILCLDMNSGERVWQTECNLGWLHNYPDNKYFAGLNEEMFTVIDSYSGDILQKKRFEGVGGSSYLSYLKGDKFYFINNSLLEPTLDSINIKTLKHSIEIELITDVKRYENVSLSSLFRRPVVEHGSIYIPTSEKEMYIFDSVYS